MKKMSIARCITICAMCIALCYVLPVFFHAIALGSILSPMHIPVLLCGIVCGPVYGLVCGIVGPVLSSLLSGMPPATGLISMVPELAVYGLVCGLLMKLIRSGNLFGDIYIALIPAMLLGRIVGGVAKALFYLGSGQAYSISAWATGYLVESVPGIIAHLILVPLLAFTLEKARLVSPRYVKQPQE